MRKALFSEATARFLPNQVSAVSSWGRLSKSSQPVRRKHCVRLLLDDFRRGQAADQRRKCHARVQAH